MDNKIVSDETRGVVARKVSELYNSTKGLNLTRDQAAQMIISEGKTVGSDDDTVSILLGLLGIVYSSSSSKQAYDKAYNHESTL